MTCQLIQTTKLDDANRAEREMLSFLSNLPESYFVYRELQVTPAYEYRLRGVKKQRPDFVVVASELGVASIEVKDWNLNTTTYEWVDQNTVKIGRQDGKSESIDNPQSQTDAYLYALKELVSGLRVYVSSLLAFPRVSRADFLNKLGNPTLLASPQTRYYLDFERILFKEDLDEWAARPDQLLLGVARRDSRHYPSTIEVTQQINERLLPSSFRIGDYNRRRENRERLKFITEQQQRWIFDLDGKQNYLLDVAGSGKTNALISRAIHLVDVAGNGQLPRILLTTYNRNLETNIRRILHHKIADAPQRQKYCDAIIVQCIPDLLEAIVMTALEIDSIDDYWTAGESHETYEKRLRNDVRSILDTEPQRFSIYDCVFVDEIQDFDDFYLAIVGYVCRGKSFFFVGDVGQKIYQRKHNLARLGLIRERIQLAKSYKMFRTPRYIAELATQFVLADPQAQQEFEDSGYTSSFQFPNKSRNKAELLHASQLEREVTNTILEMLSSTYFEDNLMIVASEKRVQTLAHMFHTAGIRYSIGESEAGGAVTIVDFMSVKGIERDVVFVVGIEDLYERSTPAAMFDDEDAKWELEQYSRRKIYVSLTRCLERLIVYYHDPTNRFVGELLRLNHEIMSRQPGGQHGI